MTLPATVKEVVITADADPNGGSETKAMALAAWIGSTGRKARVIVPRQIGIDANDVLYEGER